MISKRIKLLGGALTATLTAVAIAWGLGSRIESPADAAARTAPPTPSAILVPIEQRVLASTVVTRGTGRFGLPEAVSIAPSSLKPSAGLITILPIRNKQVSEGDVLFTASGRPVLVLQGALPAYRDFVPGLQGEDVRQLERALARLGFDPGPVDGVYDQSTAAAVARWYKARGWEPFGPTRDQVEAVRTLERNAGEAAKAALAASLAVSAAAPTIDSARLTAANTVRAAQGEVASRLAELQALESSRDAELALSLQSERAKAGHADAAAESDLAAQIAEEAAINLDPRQPETARLAAKAKVDLARSALLKTRLESKTAVQAAERTLAQAGPKIALAQQALVSAQMVEKAAKLEGERAVRAAEDARKVAEFDAKLADQRTKELSTELEVARQKLGVQVPVDELVFLHAFPVRVEELKAAVGAASTGTVLTVTDNTLSIDSSLPIDAAALVKSGMKVTIDEQALGVNATGVVETLAPTPGTHGVDGFHIYFAVKVGPTEQKLDGVSVRLTLPIKSTNGAVTAVPVSALSMAADGSSRVQVQDQGGLRYVSVKPGLAADGFVEVNAVDGAALKPGQLVVVGYNDAKSVAAQ
ncbi:MAG: peptidoglycan-binding protein [Leptothrix sp. (in: b-proteobacteria)]